jgi:citrate synthase
MNKIEEELKKVFKSIFKIEIKKISKKTNYKNVKNWDSLNHVKLIMAIESKFRLSIDPDNSINFLSFELILIYLKKNLKKNNFLSFKK